MTENKGNKNKRNRRTRDEMIAHYEAQIARLHAAKEGKADTSTETGLLKALRRSLRKRKTTLRAARITVNGVAGEEGKGWARSPMEEKIRQTEARLASQRETLARAEEQGAQLPFDIERLEAAIEAIEQGEENVEFPTDLYVLPGEENKTDEEHEAAHIASDEDSEES